MSTNITSLVTSFLFISQPVIHQHLPKLGEEAAMGTRLGAEKLLMSRSALSDCVQQSCDYPIAILQADMLRSPTSQSQSCSGRRGRH